MIGAPRPPNEERRLEALRGFDILDTPAEKAFDDLVRLALYICETPIAAVSFIDRDRQWFKSKVGLAVPETKRDISFCAHALAYRFTGPSIVFFDDKLKAAKADKK
jgi:hypothetical protein